MKKSRAGTLGITLIGVAMASSSTVVLAQGDVPAPSDGNVVELAPVVVTGTRVFGMPPSEVTGGYTVDAATVGSRTSTLLRGIPQSITVVTQERIEDQNLDTLDELAKHTPGLRVLTNDTGRSSIYARGYEYSQFNLDGLPAPMASINGTLPSLAAVDRVEIMRGPSGLLNSTSELGGIVNLVLKRPTDTFRGEVEARYGSFDQYLLQGDVSGPITADGALRGRLVVSQSDTDGFTDIGGNKGRTLYGAVEYDIGDDTNAFLAFLHQDRDITVNNGLPTRPDGSLLDLSRSTFVGARWNSFTARSNDVIAELKHDFSATGQGRAGMRFSNRHAQCNYAFGGGPLAADGTLPVAGLGCDVDQESFSADASYSQLFDLFGNPGEFVVGADFKGFDTTAARARYKSRTAIALDDFADMPYIDILNDPRARLSANQTILKETGIYAKTTIRPLKNLAIIAGARLSNYDVEYTDRVSGATGEATNTSELTPYAGVIWDIGQHHSLYASYSKVFTPQTEFDRNGQLIEPRSGTQYELGLKSTYLQGDLNTRFSVFRLYDRHHAASVPGQSYAAELDSRRVQGAEIEVNGSLTPQLDLVAGYTYLDTDVEPGKLSRGDPSAIYLLMPEHSFKLWAKYRFAGPVLDGLYVGGGVTYSSGFASSQGIEAPNYTVVDAMIGYDFTDRLSARLNVNNLFDEHYYSRVGSEGTFNFVGAPTSVTGSLNYRF